MHRTRNLLANLTTNERHNLLRYPHFKALNGGTLNPFDRGWSANCRYFFCAPRNSAGGGLLLGLDTG